MKRSLRDICVLLASFLITGCSESQEAPEAITDFLTQPRELSPAKLSIDFDGDGTADRILVTGLKGSAAALSRVATLVHPWASDKESVDKNDLASGSKKNFYIVLSKTNSGYVVSDTKPPFILDTGAAQELFVMERAALVEAGLGELSEKSKGDLMVIPTEAGIDTYLYWDGRTFVSFEPLEYP